MLPVAEIVENSRASIAEIRTLSGTGTGFIVHQSGLVITNRHVVEGDSQVNIRLATGENYQGSVIGAHPTLDLAYIEIDPGAPFKALALGDSDAIRVGDDVIAMGFPLASELGQEPSVTIGIISAKREDLGFLQTDASLNPGNSGGPLLNGYGCVVGVNTSGIVESGDGRAVSGINFAIPVNDLREALREVPGIALCRGEVLPTLSVPATTPTPVPTDTPAPAPTATPTPTPTATATPEPTPTPTPKPTETPTPQPTATPTSPPTKTPTPVPTATAIPTPIATPRPTPTPRPTSTPTPTQLSPPVWRDCQPDPTSFYRYTLKCNQHWTETEATSAAGRPFFNVRVTGFLYEETMEDFYQRHQSSLTEATQDYITFERVSTKEETIGPRNYIHTEYRWRPGERDCVYDVVERIFRSPNRPVNYAFILTAGICEGSAEVYGEQRTVILSTFEES
jgi:hypothetical protein